MLGREYHGGLIIIDKQKREYHGGIVIIDKPRNIMVMLSSLISRWECHRDLIIIDKPREHHGGVIGIDKSGEV
jgi:hypothetical protein